jgi:glyoxylate reductase
MGRIGQAVAQRAQGFNMPILFVNRSPLPAIEQALGAMQVSLDQLLERADIVSLHVPLNNETAKLIGEDQLKIMKPHAILVNAARGPVVDTHALTEALKSSQIGYAALDVTDPEPLPTSHELYQLPNAIIVPHIGSATRTARNQMALLAVDNLLAGLAGKPLPKAIQ